MPQKSFGARLRSAVAILDERWGLRAGTGSSLIKSLEIGPGPQPSAPAAGVWEHALGAQRARWRMFGDRSDAKL